MGAFRRGSGFPWTVVRYYGYTILTIVNIHIRYGRLLTVGYGVFNL